MFLFVNIVYVLHVYKIFYIYINFKHVVIRSHEDDSGDNDSKHVCIIAVFLLVRLLYLLIHSLDYLFKFI